MNMHIILSPEEVKDLRMILDRALNTIPYQNVPQWANDLSKRVDEFIEKYKEACSEDQ